MNPVRWVRRWRCHRTLDRCVFIDRDLGEHGVFITCRLWPAVADVLDNTDFGQRGHVPPEANAPEQSMPLGAGVEPTDGDPAN